MGVLATGAALALTLGACGGGSAIASKSSPTTIAGGGTQRGTGQNFPGAAGTVAAVAGSSVEVQNPQNGQVTVSWTPSTVFTKTVSVTESSVKAGECVTAAGSTVTGTLVATTVTITPPDSSGSCTRMGGAGGFGGGGGGFFRSGGGTPPSSIPNRTLPPGAANFGIASGKVTSVSPTSLVIYGFSGSGFGRRARGSTSTSTPPTTVAATNVTVDVTSSTTYNEIESATSGDVAVNDCVTAAGTADDTGAITARTIRITPAGPNGCTAGFGRGGFAGGGPVAGA
jgi:hypothetical protein